MILITDPSPATDTATDILFRSTTDRLASHCRSLVVSGSYLNWKRLAWWGSSSCAPLTLLPIPCDRTDSPYSRRRCRQRRWGGHTDSRATGGAGVRADPDWR